MDNNATVDSNVARGIDECVDFSSHDKMEIDETTAAEPNDVGVYHPCDSPSLMIAIIELDSFNVFGNAQSNAYFW